VQEEEDAALAAHVGGMDAAAHTGKCEGAAVHVWEEFSAYVTARVPVRVPCGVCPHACVRVPHLQLLLRGFHALLMRRRQRERPRGPGT
jgi:hypothetical protein